MKRHTVLAVFLALAAPGMGVAQAAQTAILYKNPQCCVGR